MAKTERDAGNSHLAPPAPLMVPLILARISAKTEEGQDCEHHDDDTNDIEDTVHSRLPALR